MSSPTADILPDELARVLPDRRTRLRQLLDQMRLDGLLVSFPRDIFYLTGFVGDDSLLILTRGDAAIISDARYDEYLEPWHRIDGIDVVIGIRHRLEHAVRVRCQDSGVRRLGVQAERLTVLSRQRLSDVLDKVELIDSVNLVPRLRMRKDEVEVASIEHGIRIQQEALEVALAELRIGMTEQELGARIEYEMKRRGASGPSFGLIIATGTRSSVIHHTTGAAPIEEGVLLVDWGAITRGYCSDMTRTFGLGDLPEKIQEVYDVVLEAQLAAIDACAPGKSCAEVDAVARRIIANAGYGAFFGHGLGHGLGLEIHEAPYFNDLETGTMLEPGMVMTVEPGIYLPGVGGVRIEDDVLITERGCRVLSSWPKERSAAVIEASGAGAAKVI